MIAGMDVFCAASAILGTAELTRQFEFSLQCLQAIEKARCTVRYLPKYSPDLNPIEMPYSKFKGFLRKIAARTVPGLTRAIRSFIPQLGAQECANYFRHAGYASI